MSVEQRLITRGALDSIPARTSYLGQAVFQVPLYRNQEKLYHARRPHKKSRGGCLTCKKRRVKVRMSSLTTVSKLILNMSVVRRGQTSLRQMPEIRRIVQLLYCAWKGL
ncbi:hypothetical protein BDV35DRAFT_339249 [Aspergillus flavus]|uniref:Uncharacterized protein n=1 Tax=Aspergillus flavus TaxID=5059 RepID=A0A5N6HD56_ASPFL|nr:hypothetical protein BDV35DRAFT_339249 [Aspergillus flavus]